MDQYPDHHTTGDSDDTARRRHGRTFLHARGESDEVLAGGYFGVQDDYAALTAGGVVGQATGDALSGGSEVAGVVGNVAGMHAAREVNAAAKGLMLRVLVAVTKSTVVLLGIPSTAHAPDRVLRTFNRVGSEVTVTKMGLSRRITIVGKDTGTKVELTGGTAFYSGDSAGVKAVCGELAGH